MAKKIGPDSNDKAAAAAAAASYRSNKKKRKSNIGYMVAIGGTIVLTIGALYLAATGGGSAKKRGGGRPSALDALVNDKNVIADVNYKTENFTAAASPFFDKWTLADFKYGFDGTVVSNMIGMPGAVQHCERDETFEGGTLPMNFDGRTKWPKCFGEVYDSGNCTSSYAIAAASSLSQRFCVDDDDMFPNLRLSPQQVLSCDKKSRGCRGGGVDYVWAYMQRRGLYPEECLPYAGEKGAKCATSCEESQKKKPISHCVLSGAKNIKREIFSHGPVVAPMQLMVDFLVYSGGIYSPTEDVAAVYGSNGKLVLHAVNIIGWGKSKEGIAYWLVENSWGTKWGEEGYAKIAIGEALMEHYAVVGYPETPAALERAEKERLRAEERKEAAKKEREEREARIAAAKRARAEAAAEEEFDDLDLDVDDESENEADTEIDMDNDNSADNEF